MSITKQKKDLTSGPIFTQMLLFVIPIMLTGILQLLYNMADHIVVGQFSGDEHALAAVGSTSSLTSLIVNLLMGISAGSSVVIAQRFGAREYNRLEHAVHTSLTFSLIGGIAVAIIGILIARPALLLMGTKEVFIDKSVLYMQIICLGVPGSAVYNFGASILRSIGDSKTPLIILSATGIVNVILNLFFVIVCGMSVDGVAIATIVAQYLSAIAAVAVLTMRKSEPYRFSFKKIGIDKATLIQILKFGIPAGVQSSLFSISNMVITSAVNVFPPTTVSAKTIAGNIDGFLYTTLNSYLHATMTFTAQNYGAMKLDRVKKSIFSAVAQTTVIGLVLGIAMIFSGRFVAGIFIDSADTNREIIIDEVMNMLKVTALFYFVCGVMETFSGALRGLGHSFSPMIITIGGVCGLRILWVSVFFPMEAFHTIGGVYTCYPISWSLTAIALAITLFVKYGQTKKALQAFSENSN